MTEPCHSLLVLFSCDLWLKHTRAARSLVYVLCFMLEHCVRIPALLSCFRLSSGFVLGFGHSHSRFGLATGACSLEFAWAVRSSVRVHCFCQHMVRFRVLFHFLIVCFRLFCLVLCGTQLVFFTGGVLSCLSCM